MSASTEHLFNVPPPRRKSPRPSMANGIEDDVPKPRSSSDHSRQLGEGSTSPRPSNSSLHQSPTSISSSPRRQHGSVSQKDERNEWHGNGDGNANHSARLPMITTSNVDKRNGEDEEDGGPRSAPVNGPLRGMNGITTSNGPPRSSSSPDPRMEWYQRDSPTESPTEYRSNAASGPPILGSPYTVANQRRHSPANLPPHQIPPLTSSHGDHQDRFVGSQTSHSSLSSGAETPMLVDHSGSMYGSTSTPRTSRRGDPTYCGQCGQLVHGQFVRAMSKVYHLNCFRCKVSWALASSLFILG